eukprot:c7517_g1_i1.p1 GENE.c7517_g1_i1~~c7517_g1_i1.p1  ORF type:complete len:632 (+),score=126.33 c7517_g1_i1:36-1931(+)
MALAKVHILAELNLELTKLPKDSEFQLMLAIYDERTHEFASTTMTANLKVDGNGVIQADQKAAIFVRGQAKDDSQLSLRCHVVRIGSLLQARSDSDTTSRHRRPVSVLSLPVTKPDRTQTPRGMTNHNITIYQLKKPQFDNQWMSIPELVKKKSNRLCVLETGQKEAAILSIQLATVASSLNECLTTFPSFNKAVICHQYPLNEVLTIRPPTPAPSPTLALSPIIAQPTPIIQQPQAELLITLVRGAFSQGTKKSSKNVEVIITPRDTESRPISNCFVMGPGAVPASRWKSVILYHDNHPIWNESVHLCFPLEMMGQVHLFVEVYHVPASSTPYPFAFGFKHIIENNHSLWLDMMSLQLYQFPFPRPSNPIFYLTPNFAIPQLPDDTVTLTLRCLCPHIRARGSSQIPSRGIDCRIHLSAFHSTGVQWLGVCKQWLPAGLVLAGNASTRVVVVLIKADVMVCYDVEPQMWDAALRSNHGPNINFSTLHTPLFSLFLEDAYVKVLGSDRHFKLGVFSWSCSYVLEVATKAQLDEFAYATKHASVRALKTAIQWSQPRSPTIVPRARVVVPKARAESIPPPLIKQHSLDPKEVENRSSRYTSILSQLEATENKTRATATAIARLQHQLRDFKV